MSELDHQQPNSSAETARADRGPLARWVALCAQRPRAVLLGVLSLTALSLAAALTLGLNTNQLEMISADSRQVQDIHRVTDMIGGAGQLTIALRGQEPDQLKAAAVYLAEHLNSAESKRVRSASYRLPIDYLRDHAAMFMETSDLKELKRRVNEKLADAEKRADPFFFEITPTEPVTLKLDDLLDKYQRVGKKRVSDDFYLSAEGEQPGRMVLVQVKPRWDSNELALTGALVQDIRAWLSERAHTVPTLKGADSQADHTPPIQLRFTEDYSPEPARDAGLIEFGFTGTYQTNYDDSFQIKESLAPVSLVAFFGVLTTLLIFFGRQLFSVLLVLSGLIIGLIITFGWAALTIGELNMITSILGGILMGLGIDFGIHLIYRFREEIARYESLPEALTVTLRGAGKASFISGLGTAAAFASLLSSDFKGFSQFGFLAGSGVILIGLSMYLWVPALVLWVERGAPGRARRLLSVVELGSSPPAAEGVVGERALPRAGLLALISGALALALTALAPNAPFEFNTRALMIEGIASVRLQDEVTARFSYGSDPVAIYTPTREAAEEVYQYFKARLPGAPHLEGDPAPLSTVDQVVGVHSFLPPATQQAQNRALLVEWAKELARIDRERLPDEVKARWTEVERALAATPFGLDELPLSYREPFESLASAREENKGFLTFVYAGVDLWDGVEMQRFAKEVEDVPVASGTYHSAGMPILFAKLTHIILRDGKLTILITALLLLLILAFDLRRLSDVLAALAPLLLGVGSMLGVMSLIGAHLNLMNIVVFPIIIGYGVSHGVYLLHRVREGATPQEALSSVGRAVACSTLTTLAGWAALLVAPHRGLQSMGSLACVGMSCSLLVSFTLMPALLELKRLKLKRSALAQVVGVTLLCLISLIGCGGARQAYLSPTFEQVERVEVIRVEVLSAPRTPDQAEVSEQLLEMWGLMTQRYLHQHRDLLPLRRAQLKGELPSQLPCAEGSHGVLLLRGEAQARGADSEVKFKAALYHCGATPGERDGLIWAASITHSSPQEDEVLITLKKEYSERFGPEAGAHAAPSFYALKELLEGSPRFKMTRDEDVMEKIELELD